MMVPDVMKGHEGKDRLEDTRCKGVRTSRSQFRAQSDDADAPVRFDGLLLFYQGRDESAFMSRSAPKRQVT